MIISLDFMSLFEIEQKVKFYKSQYDFYQSEIKYHGENAAPSLYEFNEENYNEWVKWTELADVKRKANEKEQAEKDESFKKACETGGSYIV